MPSAKILVKIFLWTVFLLLIAAIAYGGFFLYKFNALGNKIDVYQRSGSLLDTLGSVSGLDKADPSQLKSADGERINVLLLGVAGKGKPGKNLTDTIMIASINLKTNQVALLSLPRDFFVTVPGSDWQTKINAVYQSGLNDDPDDPSKAIQPLLDTVKKITSLDLQYYAVMDFDGFQQAIDAIGGINVSNERDIYDARYPGPNYSYETFELKKGFQHLDGDLALKYARERHDDPEGDFGRAKRQQQVIQAAKNKIFSAGTMFDIVAINKLFDALADNIQTNISPKELDVFFELSKKLDTNNIINATVDAWNKDSLLKVSHVFYGDVRAFILIPRVGNFSEIQDLAQNIFDLNKLKRRREEIAQENASVVIINESGDDSVLSKIQKLLSENLVYKNVTVIRDSVPKHVLEEKSSVYDSNSGTKPFTLDELATRLPAEVSYSLPDRYRQLTAKNSPDIVLVIGQDLIDKYSMEEDSIDDFKQAQDDQEYLELQESATIRSTKNNHSD